MEVADLPLSNTLIAHYETQGISTLYPTQEGAIEAGVLDGKSVVAAVPTASGKTLIAELAMLASIERGGQALYVVPLRALAAEKHDTFSALPDVSVGVATGDYDADDDDLAENDIIIATSEKVDSLIRSGTEWLEAVTCAVVDEIHLLHSEARGPTLEVTLAKLRRVRPSVQFVGLSATVANAGAIADWLDAELIESSWRPVDLRVGVYDDGRIHFADDTSRRVRGGGDDPTTSLVGETITEDGQCLVFVNSRRSAESLAGDLAPVGFGGPTDEGEAIAETSTTDTGERLAECVRGGVAFHHAGLRREHRQLVERAFRERRLAVICATPTLAAGVNVPARRVVVRDLVRYTDAGREPLSTIEVQQMCGRAGRPHLDPHGEAVLLTKRAPVEDVMERYVRAGPEAVTSKLASQDALRTHVLATIASGFASSRDELLDVLSGTFYAHEAADAAPRDVMDLVLDFLSTEEMITSESGLEATAFGEHVSRLYIDPVTGVELRDSIAAIDDGPDTEVTQITILESICTTPDMQSFYVRTDEQARIYRFAEQHESELLVDLAAFEGDFSAWLASLKTACVLNEWAAGVNEDSIVDRYGIGPGDLRTKLERAEWLLGAAETLAEHRSAEVAADIGRTRERLFDREA